MKVINMLMYSHLTLFKKAFKTDFKVISLLLITKHVGGKRVT